MTCPRLIEVALPIREISAESVRDKSLRHGHISTLHLWWARRPLPASRAIVFASLVPDPDHPECPLEFRKAVQRLLKKVPLVLKSYGEGRKAKDDPDPYQPYGDIADTPRNRLLTFIAKWSPEWIEFEHGKIDKKPDPDSMLDDRSLVKWETSDPENERGRAVLDIARQLVRAANGGHVPVVLDPFAGGGAIPLEATRLGCQAIANDYNPVAYLILRATCEFPQKYGQMIEIEIEADDPGNKSRKLPGAEERQTKVVNRLAWDVERWAKWILEHARERIGHLYPPGKDGHPVVGYLWARTAPCSNPSCRAEIPLLRSLLVCNKPDKRVALNMKLDGKDVSFGIATDKEIKQTEGTMIEKGRGAVRCPVCKQTTPVEDLRSAGLDGRLGERMVAVIVERKIKQVRSIKGRLVTVNTTEKNYRPVEEVDLASFEEATRLAENVERPSEPILPEVTGDTAEDVSNSTGIRVHLYGMKTWGSLFNSRQLLATQTLVACLADALSELERDEPDAEYRKAVSSYLGLWLSRTSTFQANVGRWIGTLEAVATPFSMQKVSMEWDYPEVSPFNESTGGGLSQLDWIMRFIIHESVTTPSAAACTSVFKGDGAAIPLPSGTIDAVVTDPPYFDAISYADLSDFFFVWLKRAVGDDFPEAFSTPLTPKTEEATALKHRHAGSAQEAERHFTSKLTACFAESRRLCKAGGVLSVMFAHQTTEAWTALINALLQAGLNVTATYPIDTERANRPRGIDSSALASSITVICRPLEVGAPASFKEVRRGIEDAVRASVHRFWGYGFRGADLIVACYGPAVGVFGRYERVERADGTPVTVPELLDTARQGALKAIAGEFQGDDLSRLYFVWVTQCGVAEQPFDDLVKVAQMAIEDEDAMEIARRRGLFVVEGAKCRLALLRDRGDRRHLGEDAAAPLIDQLHHAMQLWKEERRSHLVDYLREHDLVEHAGFWKLAQALFEVLPRNEEDWKTVNALLSERETLRKEARRAMAAEQPSVDGTLFER